MSYSFKLKDGDLTTQGSVLALAYGKNKLLQDVDLWLRELYQIDRFHQSFGSVIDNFIGNIINLRTEHDIIAEVHRVLTNLQNMQIRRLKTNPQKYTPDELLHSVTNVFTQIRFDVIIVTVFFQSVSGVVQSTRVNIRA